MSRVVVHTSQRVHLHLVVSCSDLHIYFTVLVSVSVCAKEFHQSVVYSDECEILLIKMGDLCKNADLFDFIFY